MFPGGEIFRYSHIKYHLLDKPFNIAKNPKYNGYQGGFASMVYDVFDKKNFRWNS